MRTERVKTVYRDVSKGSGCRQMNTAGALCLCVHKVMYRG